MWYHIYIHTHIHISVTCINMFIGARVTTYRKPLQLTALPGDFMEKAT